MPWIPLPPISFGSRTYGLSLTVFIFNFYFPLAPSSQSIPMFTSLPSSKENFPQTKISIQVMSSQFLPPQFRGEKSDQLSYVFPALLSHFNLLQSDFCPSGSSEMILSKVTSTSLLSEPFNWWGGGSYLKFDTAEHSFLPKTISYLGFHDIILQWFSSSISNELLLQTIHIQGTTL